MSKDRQAEIERYAKHSQRSHRLETRTADLTKMAARPTKYARHQPDDVSDVHTHSEVGFVAEIVTASDGGPIRRIINGRRNVPTGLFVARKAGSRAMPWESRLELATMEIAEVSTRVVSLLAQPHRLELPVRGPNARLLIYIPDTQLLVHPSFMDDLKSGMSFAEAAMTPSTDSLSEEHAVRQYVEVKNDFDSRDNDPDYREKIRLSKQFYEGSGFEFIELRKSKHLDARIVRTAKLVLTHRNVIVDHRDIDLCVKTFRKSNRVTYASLSEILGPGPLGRAKLPALHCRQIISIDLRRGLRSDAVVLLVVRS